MRRVCALGFFDGVHLGHAAIIKKTIEISVSQNAVPTIVTFDERPKNLLGQNPVPLISDSETKKTLIYTFFPGVEVVELHFSDELMNMPPEEFIQKVLLDNLDAVGVVVGEDFRFGKKALGTPEVLAKSISTKTVDTVSIAEEIVSSSAIRKLIAQGEMSKAARFLGHPHLICGTVEHGDSRGKKLGFATINLGIVNTVVKPKSGVYASRVSFNGILYDAVSSLGTRPTFYDEGQFVFETHILGHCRDLYDQRANVWLYEFLRSELKFDSATELVSAMRKDIENAREVLLNYRNGLNI